MLKETVKRYFIFFLNAVCISLGVALSIRADLGVSPIASISYITNVVCPAVSVGTATVLMNCSVLLAQIVILGKEFQKIQLLQVLAAVAVGSFTDFFLLVFSWLTPQSYIARLVLLMLSIAIVATGAFLCVSAKVLMNANEGLLTAISYKTGVEYGKLKVIHDILFVTATVIVSLACLGRIDGVREGTVITALLAGNVVRLLSGWLAEPLERFFKK